MIKFIIQNIIAFGKRKNWLIFISPLKMEELITSQINELEN
jgi:hypothetical protein